ncbi:sensor histidine kinase [Aquipuribacter hungaricus]|uniref:histidine kinase n=1 Tax=Aquipuribacter hungaricus TaxID=545624 RepID=A0ABV7WBG9_9MICO
MPPAPDLRRWSLARQLLLLQGALVLLVVVVATGLAWADAAEDADEAAAQQVTAVARSVADSPDVLGAVGSAAPSSLLQPYAERVRRDTGTDFVVVMSPGRTRWSHPDPDQLGRPFLGTVAPALRGETFTETFTGTLGPSVRAVTPVLDPSGEVVALVSVGLSVDEVGDQLRAELPLLGAGALLVLAIAGAGTLLVARRLRRLTYGLGAEELSRMYACYDAVLHSVREGLVVLDPAGRVQLANDEARRLLGLPDDLAGRRADELGLPGGLVEVLAGDEVVHDAVHLARERVVVVSGAPAEVDGRVLGRVVTLRDRTDLRALAGDLDAARGLAESLRSQAHESANRLHTVVSLLELGRTEEAVGFAVDELAAVQALTDRVVGAVEEPVVAAVLLGKSAVAAERGVDLVLADGTELDADGLRDSGLVARDVVTLLGNLVDNAVDAAASAPAPRRVEVLVRRDGTDLLLEVADSGPGLDPATADEAFTRGWSTKPAGQGRPQGRGLGLALVGQTVRRLGGTVEVGRRDGAVFTVRLPLAARVPA